MPLIFWVVIANTFFFIGIIGHQAVLIIIAILLCLADAFTYFICTLSGFVALWLLLQSGITKAYIPATAGEATWLIFLALYSLLGITGKLPEVLTRLHLPGAGH